jgi:anti-sigma factor RsiW
MSGDLKHPDVLGFVAGLSAPEEAGAIAAHVDGCAECRSEAAALRSMRRSLRAQSEAHVSIEDLVAHDEDPLNAGPGLREVIESHIGWCPDCRSDLESLSRARRLRDDATRGPRPAAPPESAVRAARRRSIPWAAVAAAVVVVTGAGLVIAPWRRPGTPSLPTRSFPAGPGSVTFMPPKRSGIVDRSLVAGERVSLRVVLPYGTSDGSYRARIERDDGLTVVQPMTAASIDADTLTVEIEVPVVPGAYRLVLVPEGRPESAAVVYPFRVQAGISTHRGAGE